MNCHGKNLGLISADGPLFNPSTTALVMKCAYLPGPGATPLFLPFLEPPPFAPPRGPRPASLLLNPLRAPATVPAELPIVSGPSVPAPGAGPPPEKTENEKLKNTDRFNHWIYGGGLVFGGVLLSFILQAFGRRKRRSEWR